MLYACHPSGPEFRAEMSRNFGVVRANNPEAALEAFRLFIGANTVAGFVASELRDDDSFSPFLVETSHVPVGKPGTGHADLTSGGDRLAI